MTSQIIYVMSRIVYTMLSDRKQYLDNLTAVNEIYGRIKIISCYPTNS